jgi:hypothetical protein
MTSMAVFLLILTLFTSRTARCSPFRHATRLRSTDHRPYRQRLGFAALFRFVINPLFLFSTFFPVSQLPDAVKWVAAATPSTTGGVGPRRLNAGRHAGHLAAAASLPGRLPGSRRGVAERLRRRLVVTATAPRPAPAPVPSSRVVARCCAPGAVRRNLLVYKRG